MVTLAVVSRELFWGSRQKTKTKNLIIFLYVGSQIAIVCTSRMGEPEMNTKYTTVIIVLVTIFLFAVRLINHYEQLMAQKQNAIFTHPFLGSGSVDISVWWCYGHVWYNLRDVRIVIQQLL